MSDCMYEWNCNRCESSCYDTYRPSVQAFAEHHMQVMHPLFARQPRDTAPRIRSARLQIGPIRHLAGWGRRDNR